eukprot:TRINITY_DN23550_c0_g1_i1.p1 TRINITY_DN23550_c0_g1~~TRINITY_DN23550_c0_g1_i1.p1  ORF type:complete len:597 (+),score=73.97 TRINITY_DN23550_c0_g1_i1:77-1867(+)
MADPSPLLLRVDEGERLPDPTSPQFPSTSDFDEREHVSQAALPERLSSESRRKIDDIRERYLYHLGQTRLVQSGFVPNLVPILRWRQSANSRNGTPASSPLSAQQTLGTPKTSCENLASMSSRWSRRISKHDSSVRDECALATGTAVTKEHMSSTSSFLQPGSVGSSVVNISAATLGAGALALPRAIYYSGIVFGPLFMAVLCVLSMMSIKVIVQLVEVSRKDTYEEIAKAAFGPWYALFVEANIILFCFGTAVAYMITVGQISHQVLDAVMPTATAVGTSVGAAWWQVFVEPNAVLCLITLVVLLPLSMLDAINDLRFTSFAGVGCIIYLIAVVMYVFFAKGTSDSLVDSDGFTGFYPKGGFLGCFQMVALAIFAFCCQPNVPSIYTELERKSFHRMDKVSMRSMSLCLFVYLLMGVTGFLAFGEETAGNILGNLQPLLCECDTIVVSGFACMAFAVTMAFPLNIFPIRFAVEIALFYYMPHMNTRFVRSSIAIAAVFSCLVVAIALPEINLIFELIGATTGSFVCFISPGVLFCRLAPGPLLSRLKFNALVLIVAGCIFLVLGTYSSILDVLKQTAAPASSKQGLCAALAGPAS